MWLSFMLFDLRHQRMIWTEDGETSDAGSCCLLSAAMQCVEVLFGGDCSWLETRFLKLRVLLGVK